MEINLNKPINITEECPLPNVAFFCQGCNSHREQFKPSECLRLYLTTAAGNRQFAGFLCPKCHKVETNETVRFCGKYGDCTELGCYNPAIEPDGYCLVHSDEWGMYKAGGKHE